VPRHTIFTSSTGIGMKRGEKRKEGG
jgi:hypothetical protein